MFSFWVMDIGARRFREEQIPAFIPVELPDKLFTEMAVVSKTCPGYLIGIIGSGMTTEELDCWISEHPDWYKKYKNPADKSMEDPLN